MGLTDMFPVRLFGPLRGMPMATDDELPFKVEQWDCEGNGIERGKGSI